MVNGEHSQTLKAFQSTCPLDPDNMTITAAEVIHIYVVSAVFNVCLKSYSLPTAAVGLGLSL